MAARWNSNGNWLVTGSRDHLLKLFDIRMMKELQTFRGHKKEATGSVLLRFWSGSVQRQPIKFAFAAHACVHVGKILAKYTTTSLNFKYFPNTDEICIRI